MKESAKLTKRVAMVRDEIEVARQLALLLKSDRFEKWLVNEALERLCSARPRRSSCCRATVRACRERGRQFEVVDHRNADELRAAKTLSGGETFQASLALALALSDQVGVDWPREARRSSTRSSSTKASARSTPTPRRGRDRVETLGATTGWWASSRTCASSPSGCPCATRS